MALALHEEEEAPQSTSHQHQAAIVHQHHHRRSLPSHLLWRSALGSPAAWSGSSYRGVYLLDSADNNNGGNSNNNINNSSMIQHIPTDKRMHHLPTSLRDVIFNNLLSTLSSSSNLHTHTITHSIQQQQQQRNRINKMHSTPSIQLLSHPRIVGAAQPSRRSTFYSSSYGRAFSGSTSSNGGISCMDIDHGNDADSTLTGSPSRYLLVGSGGGDCSIALYDLSYFGSDQYLYQQSSSSFNKSSSQQLNSQSSTMHNHQSNNNQASVTHRPIARSIRHASTNTPSAQENNNAGGVPSGHRHPLLGVHWYPADTYGAFVSASISGEILVWDAQNFVPVFATYTHIYTGAASTSIGGDIDGKAVAPLQCMDLPKSPESCPHGNALLALGLGGDGGRGVIQLCDAFRGGSATHELIGHGSNSNNGGGNGGGVNAIAWDPCHPFRLASGGDDCTVRLWDIRKAGEAACLGVLDRENNEMMHDDNNDDDYWTQRPPRKRQKAGSFSTNNMSSRRMHNSGVESHGGPVTALAFAPDGDNLVSTGLDGRICHWDLRPDSGFVSSMAAITSSGRERISMEGRGGGGGGGMDPAVATGGRLLPTCFTNTGGTSKKSSSTQRRRQQSPSHNKPSLAIIQPGSRCTATLLSTANYGSNSLSKGEITGYSLYGRRDKEPGGNPDFVLSGHLADVTCLVPIAGMWDNLKVGGKRSDDNDDSTTTTNHVSFLTGGEDGMVLSWGSSRQTRRQVSHNEIDDGEDNNYSFYRKAGPWQNHSRGGRRVGVCSRPTTSNQEEPSFLAADMDNW